MAKRVVTEYYCDICGAQVFDKEDLTTYTVPVLEVSMDEYGRELSRRVTGRKLDFCDACAKRMAAIRVDSPMYGKEAISWLPTVDWWCQRGGGTDDADGEVEGHSGQSTSAVGGEASEA